MSSCASPWSHGRSSMVGADGAQLTPCRQRRTAAPVRDHPASGRLQVRPYSAFRARTGQPPRTCCIAHRMRAPNAVARPTRDPRRTMLLCLVKDQFRDGAGKPVMGHSRCEGRLLSGQAMSRSGGGVAGRQIVRRTTWWGVLAFRGPDPPLRSWRYTPGRWRYTWRAT